jgi:hypothetical protein
MTLTTPTAPRWLLSLTLTAAVAGALALAARDARADVCFGGGYHYVAPDAHPDAGAGDGATLGLGRGSRTGRYADGGLVLVAGLGLVWIGGRRQGRTGGGAGGRALTTEEDRRPPTERSR